MTAEIATNTTTSARIRRTDVRSSTRFSMLPHTTSRASEELEVSTSEESVLIEAESTRTTTMPMRMSGTVESIVGTIESKTGVPSAP